MDFLTFQINTDNQNKFLLFISNNVPDIQKANLILAFKMRNDFAWSGDISKYGYGLTNIDEVLTHIMFVYLFGCEPSFFEIEQYLT